MIISYAEWWLFLLNSSIINPLNNWADKAKDY